MVYYSDTCVRTSAQQAPARTGKSMQRYCIFYKNANIGPENRKIVQKKGTFGMKKGTFFITGGTRMAAHIYDRSPLGDKNYFIFALGGEGINCCFATNTREICHAGGGCASEIRTILNNSEREALNNSEPLERQSSKAVGDGGREVRG